MVERKGIQRGMVVKSRDGAQVGRVIEVSDLGLLVEKGVFFIRDYVIPFREVEAVSGDEVLLTQTREHLERVHREGAVMAAIESGRLAQGPADLTEARMDSAKFQDHEQYEPTSRGWVHHEGAVPEGRRAGPSGNLGLEPTALTEARMDSAKFQNHGQYELRPEGPHGHEEVLGPERRASGPGWDALSEEEKRESPRTDVPEDTGPKTRY